MASTSLSQPIQSLSTYYIPLETQYNFLARAEQPHLYRIPWKNQPQSLQKEHGLDSIAVSLFGSMTVDTGEILIHTSKECIRTKDSDTENGDEDGILNSYVAVTFRVYFEASM